MVSDGSPVLVQGWDSEATVVDGGWIERRPRRPEVAHHLLVETRLMPWLAPSLPLAVPRPFVVSTDPLVVRHELVPGEPTEHPEPAGGRELGAFLRALHATDVAEALARRLPSAADTVRARAGELARFRELVLPLLPDRALAPARALLAAVDRAPADTVVHGDLGPEHVLFERGRLTGVIDFTDAHVGDPALDLAWCLYGAPPEFAAALAREYEPSPAVRDRALMWHRLGTWFHVVYGLDTEQPAEVRSGLDGVLRRLLD
ncbi:phosphotransferase [Pseudonocardia acaciae]|uniref:phosphotransferase n=1 Tax=Pseudonocardia acaciae TaxID=551276 RepID=UPI00048AE661|nr:phosphotransferase [Pseudonocardia acaciae]